MAYLHCRMRTRTQDSGSKPYQYIALCRTFHIGSDPDPDPIRMVSKMVTVPILGTDVCPRDRCSSLLHTFQSGDQSLNPNQWVISAQYRNLSPSRDLSPDQAMWISHKLDVFTALPAVASPGSVGRDGHLAAWVRLCIVDVQFERFTLVWFDQGEQILRLKYKITYISKTWFRNKIMHERQNYLCFVCVGMPLLWEISLERLTQFKWGLRYMG